MEMSNSDYIDLSTFFMRLFGKLFKRADTHPYPPWCTLPIFPVVVPCPPANSTPFACQNKLTCQETVSDMMNIRTGPNFNQITPFHTIALELWPF